jgi:hypothetical protein
MMVGTRYRMEEGKIEVESIESMGFPDITPGLARESGPVIPGSAQSTEARLLGMTATRCPGNFEPDV